MSEYSSNVQQKNRKTVQHQGQHSSRCKGILIGQIGGSFAKTQLFFLLNFVQLLQTSYYSSCEAHGFYTTTSISNLSFLLIADSACVSLDMISEVQRGGPGPNWLSLLQDTRK